jgi:hypothetical protein
MNALEKFIHLSGLDETAAMNRLQENNVISDNCIIANDVADVDCGRAIDFLKNPHERVAE